MPEQDDPLTPAALDLAMIGAARNGRPKSETTRGKYRAALKKFAGWLGGRTPTDSRIANTSGSSSRTASRSTGRRAS